MLLLHWRTTTTDDDDEADDMKTFIAPSGCVHSPRMDSIDLSLLLLLFLIAGCRCRLLLSIFSELPSFPALVRRYYLLTKGYAKSGITVHNRRVLYLLQEPMPNVQWSKCDLWLNNVSASPLLFVQCTNSHFSVSTYTSNTRRRVPQVIIIIIIRARRIYGVKEMD